MNIEFKTWTRSQSFVLCLHEQGIINLLAALRERRAGIKAFNTSGKYSYGGVRIPPAEPSYERYGIKLMPSAANYLVRRGLVKLNDLEEYALTEAGHLVALLLEEAGYPAPLLPDAQAPRETAALCPSSEPEGE